MKQLALAGFALILSTSAASAEGINLSTTVGAERALESEVNTLYGSVGLGIATVGATMEDTAENNAEFNIKKYEVDFSQPVGPVTLYMKNDFDDGFKHTETVVGGKISF